MKNNRDWYHHCGKFIIGGHVDYRLNSNSHNLTLACEMKPDANTVVKAKIDSTALLSCSFKQMVAKRLSLTLCGEVDMKDMSADSHKFGCGIEFE